MTPLGDQQKTLGRPRESLMRPEETLGRPEKSLGRSRQSLVISWVKIMNKDFEIVRPMKTLRRPGRFQEDLEEPGETCRYYGRDQRLAMGRPGRHGKILGRLEYTLGIP